MSDKQLLHESHCKACLHSLSDAIFFGKKDTYNLYSCSSCKTVVIDPLPTEDELNEFYTAYSGTKDYHSKQDKKILRSKKRLQRLQKFINGNKLLDIGCNCGFTVKAGLDIGFNAHGIDIDSMAVSFARKAFGHKNFSVFSVSDFAKHNGNFNLIYASEVIEHVLDPDLFVSSISRLLDKEGILYLTTPDAGHWRVPKSFAEFAIPPEHITYFTRKGIAALLKRHGLHVLKFQLSLKPGIKLIARKS